MRPGVKGTETASPASAAAFSMAAAPPRTIRSAIETLLVALLRGVELLLDGFKLAEHDGELGRLVDFPVLLRGQTDARAIGAAALVGAAEGRGRRPGGGHQIAHRQTGGEDLHLERGNVGVIDQPGGRARGIGSCQIRSSAGTSGPR